MQPDGLILRDIHLPPAPAWWPLAPGWWLVMALVAAIAIALGWWLARRRRRRHAIAQLFDDALVQAATPAEQVAAMSELLRRAARRHDLDADRYTGEAWLQCLDAGLKQPTFVHGAGRLLLDGAYRVDVDSEAVAALRPLARERYLSWMAAR